MEYSSYTHDEQKSNVEDPFYLESDLALGTYGPDVDKYLGRSPADGPPGYVFQKVSYTSVADASKDTVAGSYKNSPDHSGLIYGSSGNTFDATQIFINKDAFGQDASTLGEARLQSGDYVLGSILQLIDGRATDSRTGTVIAGLVSNDSAVEDTYGEDLTLNPSEFVLSSAIGGGRVFAADSVRHISVASPNLNIYTPVKIRNTSGDGAAAEIGAPINAITCTGVTPGSSGQIRFVLHVYALVGARQKTVSHYTQPDPSFTMGCLTKKIARHPVNAV
jgi:hypothetical protein